MRISKEGFAGRKGSGGYRSVVVGLAVAATLTLSACGDDAPTGPGETGLVEAYIEDRPAGALIGSESAPQQQTTSGEYSGTLNADAQVQISADGTTWVDLGSPSSVAVDLRASGEGTQVHGSVAVPADTYSHVRLVLQGAEANVAAGSTIGGITLTGVVGVALGSSGEITIEKTVPPFEVGVAAATRVTWNMNTHLWMDEDAVEEEEVEESEVEDAAEPRAGEQAEQPN